jgi:hypothetical protein
MNAKFDLAGITKKVGTPFFSVFPREETRDCPRLICTPEGNSGQRGMVWGGSIATVWSIIPVHTLSTLFGLTLLPYLIKIHSALRDTN